MPPAEAGVCGAAVCVPGPVAAEPVDVWLTEVEPADVGEETVWVVWFTMLDPPAAPGTVAGFVVGVLMDWMTARLGIEPPLPLTGTVVVTGLTVVLVVAAAGAVVGGVLVGTVVAGAAGAVVTGGAVALLPSVAGVP
jgi:hypothetical protein